MNPFFNPITLARVASDYVLDINRIWRYSPEKIERYRERAFQRVLRNAMKTPMYREKYRGIDLSRITLKTIDRLPILTKQDIRKHFPHGVVPEGYDTRRALTVSTSGSTGQPTSIYTDFYTIIKALMGFIRELEACGMSWRTRMSVIVDLTPRAIEEAYLVKGMPFKFNHVQLLDVGENVERMIEKIDAFRPRFIGGYPGVLMALAVLKRKGYGTHIEPEVIASSGAVLDEYTKRYIEETFNARVFDVYGSTEAGPVAFECRKGNYHIHHDMVHLEFLDDRGEPVAFGTPGHIVVTKLYGNATPIIRYNGLNDFVIPLERRCDCGINTPLIESVAGRMVDALVMPSGAIIPPFAVTGIPAKVMERLNSDIVQQFQIVQEDYDRIIVSLVMEADRTNGEKKQVMGEIQREFEKRMEEGVTVQVREVEKIPSEGPIPQVIHSRVAIR